MIPTLLATHKNSRKTKQKANTREGHTHRKAKKVKHKHTHQQIEKMHEKHKSENRTHTELISNCQSYLPRLL